MNKIADQDLLEVVTVRMLRGASIAEALAGFECSPEQFERIRHAIEVEFGDAVVSEVGEGIGGSTHSPWVDTRDIDWFHWNRLRNFWLAEGKLAPGAILSIDQASHLILDKMPPPEIEDFQWMGMIVGNVQAGKTANFTATICRAADAGYRLFIVLSGMLKTLRLQTQRRISKEILGKPGLGGPAMPDGRVWHPLTADHMEGDFADPGGMKIDLLQEGQTPSIAVIKKNASVMSRLNGWLEDMQLEHPEVIGKLPVMIIDDESDEASIDTSDGDPSTVNAELRRMLGIFKRRAYLGFTATPYANCFIPDDATHPDYGDDLYPKDFILPLRTPKIYFGSERVFGRAAVWDSKPVNPIDGICVVVPRDQAAALIPSGARGHVDFQPEMQASLRRSILSYFLAGAARFHRGESQKPCTMLVHISRHRIQHARQAELVGGLQQEVYGRISGGNGYGELARELQDIWNNDLRRTIRAMNPSADCDFSEVEQHLDDFVSQVDVRVINQDSDDVIDFTVEPALKSIVIGGQNLGRGLTLEGLVTTYFLRESGNLATAMQMQRWCGFRQDIADLIRVYTTKDISDFFNEFLAIEEEMRRELIKFERDRVTPSEIGMRLRQHPSVPLVPRDKVGARRLIGSGYRGRLPQTTVFPMRDFDLFSENFDALSDFLRDLAQYDVDWEGEARAVWTDCSPRVVLSFLEKYRYPTHSGRASFNSKSVVRYINACLDRGELANWTVALCGLQDDANGPIEINDSPLDRDVYRVQRSPVEDGSDRLGIITDPKHEGIGLTGGAQGADARASRPKSNGLLLIYPIVHPTEPDSTIVGVAISFSGELTEDGDVYAGSVLVEEEVATS